MPAGLPEGSAGVRESFARAETLLAELAGWNLDDETIRRLCHAEADRAAAGRAERATAEVFVAAAGDLEVQIDAGKVWRDVKVGVFARRERGGAGQRGRVGPAGPAGSLGPLRRGSD